MAGAVQGAASRGLLGLCVVWSCGTLGQQTNFDVGLEMVFHENIDGLGGRQAQNRWRIKDPWTVLSALEFVYYDDDLEAKAQSCSASSGSQNGHWQQHSQPMPATQSHTPARSFYSDGGHIADGI